jgi:hypothetical protein
LTTFDQTAKSRADLVLIDVAQIEDDHAISGVQNDVCRIPSVARRELATTQILEEPAAVLVLFVLVDPEYAYPLDQVQARPQQVRRHPLAGVGRAVPGHVRAAIGSHEWREQARPRAGLTPRHTIRQL